ncbi:Protein of unknown function [Gryllus bimaculatus]|nr:Protein of unknown function [Gryllus bimaculatus]
MFAVDVPCNSASAEYVRALASSGRRVDDVWTCGRRPNPTGRKVTIEEQYSFVNVPPKVAPLGQHRSRVCCGVAGQVEARGEGTQACDSGAAGGSACGASRGWRWRRRRSAFGPAAPRRPARLQCSPRGPAERSETRGGHRVLGEARAPQPHQMAVRYVIGSPRALRRLRARRAVRAAAAAAPAAAVASFRIRDITNFLTFIATYVLASVTNNRPCFRQRVVLIQYVEEHLSVASNASGSVDLCNESVASLLPARVPTASLYREPHSAERLTRPISRDCVAAGARPRPIAEHPSRPRCQDLLWNHATCGSRAMATSDGRLPSRYFVTCPELLDLLAY